MGTALFDEVFDLVVVSAVGCEKDMYTPCTPDCPVEVRRCILEIMEQRKSFTAIFSVIKEQPQCSIYDSQTLEGWQLALPDRIEARCP